MSELLTRDEFDARLAGGSLALSLVGMSNVGKTFWSKQFETGCGFNRLCCDDIIEDGLSDVLKELGYEGGIADMARWMGQPHETQFAANQQRYLDLETHAMSSIIDQLDSHPTVNSVVDTTGSVVHVTPQIHQRLAGRTTVVYLEATPDMQQEMFKRYIKEPKPVIWKESYSVEDDETPIQTLTRCYPELLARRASMYEQMAQVTLSQDVLLSMNSASDFLRHIRDAMPLTA